MPLLIYSVSLVTKAGAIQLKDIKLLFSILVLFRPNKS